MNFKDVKNIKILEGTVIKITDSNGIVLWIKKGNVEPDTPDNPDIPVIPDLPIPNNNEIYYISTDSNIISTKSSSYDGLSPISNTYENGKGVMVFEKDLTELRKYMFSRCDTLLYISIPSTITTIGESVFGYCSALKTIVIPDSVTSLADYVFDNCTSLESITIPENLTTIGKSVFQKCSSLKSVTIPEGVTVINSDTFYNCSSLQSVILPDSLTKILSSAFARCSSLQSVTIPDNVTSIVSYSFQDCSSLNEIFSLNITAPRIYENTFEGVADVGTLYVPQGSAGYISWLEVLPNGWTIQYLGEQKNNELYYTSTDNNIVQLYSNYKGVQPISNTYKNGKGVMVFEKDLTELEQSMFRYNENLKTITIPSTVTSIGNYVFYDCTTLETIVIPDSVTSLGYHVFYGCTSLKDVTLSHNLKTITTGTFQECSSLAIITIPKNITKLENGVFSDCTSLQTVLSYPLYAPSVGEYTFDNTGNKPGKTIKVLPDAIGYCDGYWYDYVLDKYGWGVEYTL